MLGQMESVLGADSTIISLCDDIVEHYEKYRANLLTGKAQEKKISPVMYILAVLFLVKYFLI